jgi:YVTN family beta-propeller protein
VANYNTGSVSVVDTATLATVASIGVGSNPVGVAVHAVPAAPTKLVAGSAALQLRLLGFGVKGVNAKLTESHTGRAVVGVQVVFTTVKGNPLCTATTDANGVAKCDAVVPLLVGLATLLQGYTASYAGTPEHGPSTSHGFLRLL